MSSENVETLMARLLVDAKFRAAFLRDPTRIAELDALTAAERAAMLAIDVPGLCMAARSIAAKRGRWRGGLWRRMIARIRPD